MGFFRPAWMDSNFEKAKNAVMKINDQKTLAKVVIKSKDFRLRDLALSKISNQRMLEELFFANRKNNFVRSSIVEMLDNVALLDKIIMDENEASNVRAAAIKTHPDPNQEILAQIAANIRYDSNCSNSLSAGSDTLVAIERLENQMTLKQFAYDKHVDDKGRESSISKQVRMAAIKGIKDQNMLMEIINHTDDAFYDYRSLFSKDLKVVAVKQITDPVLLNELAKEGWRDAISRVTDIDVLEEIVSRCDNNWNTRGIRPNAGDFAHDRIVELKRGMKHY